MLGIRSIPTVFCYCVVFICVTHSLQAPGTEIRCQVRSRTTLTGLCRPQDEPEVRLWDATGAQSPAFLAIS